ncbi:MAG TPA: GNAT family N-acetyltransferase [Terriglobales bacterium]|nr:GNAT family N-acetyltransferase [Terriglobales bacterium]
MSTTRATEDLVEQEHTPIRIRAAVPADVSELHKLIEASVRGLMPHGYTKDQLDGALGTLLGVDTQLIADGTYFVAEAGLGPGMSILVGCGGWSKRKTLFGSDHRPGREDELLDPHIDAAKIRAFFVHPEWARRGIGSRILEVCERAAEAAGFRRLEMGATLTGVPMYRARGYVETGRIEVPLANGASLSVVHMSKAAREP